MLLTNTKIHLLGKCSFTMSISLHGLLELVSSSFPRCDRSSIPKTGSSMTRLLHSAEVHYFSHKRLWLCCTTGDMTPVHTTLRMGPSTKDSPITEFLYFIIRSISILMVNSCCSIPFSRSKSVTTHSLRY
jgi:hypothetical protein